MTSASVLSPPPRYDGANLLNLTATLDAAFGNASPYLPLAERALRERIMAARCVVLWLIDGLGLEPLLALSPQGALAASVRAELASVYPSSTAAAVTTLATARPPVAHAVPEWFLWFEEFGAVYRALPLGPRDPQAGLPPVVDASTVYPQPALTRRADRPCVAVLPAHLAGSAYSRYAYAGARIVGVADEQAFVQAIVQAVEAAPAGCFVFAYEPRFDEAAHAHGVASDAAAAVVRRLDVLFERLAPALAARGALLLVTADHGFVDIPRERRLQLAQFPRLQRLLA
ncbi:MAG: alkaline phosphatase family protein, partial [Burkholderiaceae bacterium]|nr:alkaline phosphatase family protein [Burkholderiaceae bacterium]